MVLVVIHALKLSCTSVSVLNRGARVLYALELSCPNVSALNRGARSPTITCIKTSLHEYVGSESWCS